MFTPSVICFINIMKSVSRQMPGGLSRENYNADRLQLTHPYDEFWGRRKLASLGYQFQPDRASTSSIF